MILRDRNSVPPGGYTFKFEGENITGVSYVDLLRSFRDFCARHGVVTGDVEALMNASFCLNLTERGLGGFCTSGTTVPPYEMHQLRAVVSDPRGPQSLHVGKAGADGRAWRKWHLLALDGKLTPQMVSILVAQIGCSDCKTHTQQYIQKHPLKSKLTAPEQFEWTVAFHNRVNRRIGKKQISHEQALAIWQNTPAN